MWKVVAADDEAYMRDVLENLIDWKKCDCELVSVVSDGAKMIEAIKKITPDIVITDIQMPLKNGIEVCKFVSENFPKTEIIILTAYSDFEYAKNAITYNVCEYVLKVEVVDDLVKALEKAVSRIETSLLSFSQKISDADSASLYTRVNKYIDAHLTERITVEDIASEVFASKSYISRLYKSKSGINLIDAIQQKKIMLAKKYFENSEMKIYEVSEAVGFTDPGYFSRIFKKYTNMSPKEFIDKVEEKREK